MPWGAQRRTAGQGLSHEQDEAGRLPFHWQLDALEKLQYLELYASVRVAKLSTAAHGCTYRWDNKARHDQFGPAHLAN